MKNFKSYTSKKYLGSDYQIDEKDGEEYYSMVIE